MSIDKRSPTNIEEDSTLLAAKLRYQEWVNKGSEGGDEEAFDILKLFNSFSGIAPYYSCVSHPEVGDYDGYFCCYVSADSEWFFTKIYKEFRDALNERIPGSALPHDVRLGMGALYDVEQLGNTAWINVMDIRFTARSIKTKKYLLEVLEDTLHKLRVKNSNLVEKLHSVSPA